MRADSQGPDESRPVIFTIDATGSTEVLALIVCLNTAVLLLAAQRVALEGDDACTG